eukprot:SAG22_NODE_157_length_16986_cov_17.230177_12_plen_149_part_00
MPFLAVCLSVCPSFSDWETGAPNSVACFVRLWGYVANVLRPHGIKLQTDIDNSGGGSGDPSPWGYLWNFVPMVPAFDYLVNMGSYPANRNLPAAGHLAEIKGYIDSMLAHMPVRAILESELENLNLGPQCRLRPARALTERRCAIALY